MVWIWLIVSPSLGGIRSTIPAHELNRIDGALDLRQRGSSDRHHDKLIVDFLRIVHVFAFDNGEFDPGSERTLAAWIRHASRTRKSDFGLASRVANG